MSRYAAPLISFTMNIAGDIKHDPLIERAFFEGARRVRREFERMGAKVLEENKAISFTGCEMLWSVQWDAQELKKRMCRIEESDALGRLFDLDVIAMDGSHLNRESERRCLICGAPVRACARSRAHSAQELYEKAHEIIRTHFREQYICRVGELAQRALLYEAITTPKPGLVDCGNSGSHSDMDLFSFMASAAALRPYLEDCVNLGFKHAGWDTLQHRGRLAEDEMFHAAHANTHKGAIFSLGILCHAMGFCGEGAQLSDVLATAAETGAYYLSQIPDANHAQTGGEKQYHLYGLTGARGEAASGFRTVTETALPALESMLEDGKPMEEACLHALLTLMAQVQDANIIRRAGMDTQQWVMNEAKKLLQNGCTRDELNRLNKAFIQKNISPGGSADLLAVAVFLHFCKERGLLS